MSSYCRCYPYWSKCWSQMGPIRQRRRLSKSQQTYREANFARYGGKGWWIQCYWGNKFSEMCFYKWNKQNLILGSNSFQRWWNQDPNCSIKGWREPYGTKFPWGKIIIIYKCCQTINEIFLFIVPRCTSYIQTYLWNWTSTYSWTPLTWRLRYGRNWRR